MADALDEYNIKARQAHKEASPRKDNLLALVFAAPADLTDTQREQMTTTLTFKGYRVQDYNLAIIRETLVELFFAPRSSFDSPSLRPSTTSSSRSFCVLHYGDLQGQSGCWVGDDQTFEEDLVPESEDIFRMMDEYGYWSSRPSQRRRMRKGPGSGKGKAKGRKGR